MKKIILSASVILSFALYAFLNAPSVTTVSTPAATVTTTHTAAPTKIATTVTPSKTGQYSDGTYIGSARDAYYGYVQVKATISGGRIADVAFVQYPNDRSTSRAINSQATVLLRQEAIQAQSANVSGVSGASDTSSAFRQSLADALAQAKA